MNTVVVLLAMAYAVMGRPDDPTPTVIPAGYRETCPGKCVLQDKYRQWFAGAVPKAKDFMKQISEQGAAATQVIPPLNVEKWTEYCTEVGNIKTCIEACGDDEKKTKALAIVNAVKDIVCDEEIKGKANCLLDVGKTPNENCNTECKPHFDELKTAYERYKQKPPGEPINWERAKSAGKNMCQLVNCRLKCRKADFEQKCQADGYNAAKKLTKELAVLAKTVHAQFRDPANFPDECGPDSVVQGA